MKKIVVALTTLAAAQFCFAADSAGLAGIMNTSEIVEVNNMPNPRDIWTVYFANDPSQSSVVLAYVVYRKLGKHQASIEWTDQKGNPLDKCSFTPDTITKVPHIQALTCKWGGRLPDGGLTCSVYNRFENKKEKIGEMFLPSKTK